MRDQCDDVLGMIKAPHGDGYLGTPRRKRRGRTRADQGRLNVDRGTAELQAKKAALLPSVPRWRKGRIRMEADSQGSTEPLDLLLVHGAITRRQHQAGDRYRRLFEVIYGMTSQGSTANWREIVPDKFDTDSWKDGHELTMAEQQELREKNEARLQEGNAALDRIPAGRFLGCKAILRACVLDRTHPKVAERQALRWALDALADAWKIKEVEI